MVVDDNQTNCAMLQKQLKAWNLEPYIVNSGVEALRIINQNRQLGIAFDLAILDMQMPGMNGLELAELIRQLPSCAHIKLVMASSHYANQWPEEIKNTFDYCLRKPLRQSILREVLSGILQGPKFSKAEHAAQDAQQQRALLQIEQEKKQASLKRILVVEDNTVNQMVAVKLLQKFGYQSQVAHNGKEGVEAFNAESFDLILMDCQMPIMDGYVATATIRQSHAKQIPIIGLTANAMEGDREKCLQSGMNDYLSKPIDIEKLKEILAKWA
ncbi:response regulator [Thiomicrorhabdus aquaedulcis]|uniref:response regulator n=1 Tax=Thiomicrorhabdus aquaedulcis TaxID=2211106 RepID=UPI0022B298C2|nr:response regulator [Thiomicrorhabdus aquaedulcis]